MATGRPATRAWLPYSLAVVAGLAVIGGAYVIVRPDPDPGGDRSSCVALEVNSSTDKDQLLGELAKQYNAADRRFGGRCAQVSVHGLNSGKAMKALEAGNWAGPTPQVWLPASSLWTSRLRILEQNKGRPAQTAEREYPSIATSPLVIAMPREKGELVRQRGKLGWADVLGLSGDAGWEAFGRPKWGPFTFVKDNPNLSTSGLAATIATYYAAVGRSSDLIKDDLDERKVTQFVRRIEANVSHYSDDSVELLRDLAKADLGAVGDPWARDMSAVVVQEELVFQYNEGLLSPTPGDKPRVPLVALYPKEGTFNLDHPYVVLASADEAQRAAAQDFLAFLQAEPQQRRFAELGFRDPEGLASDALVAAVRSEATTPDPKLPLDTFDPPEPEVVDAILKQWGELRKKANILLAMDTSGSMTAKVDDDSTRFEVAAAAADKGVGLLNPDDRVALWSFSSDPPRQGKPYSEEVPLGSFNPAAFKSSLNGLRVEGDTALYTTVRAAHRHMLDKYEPDRINAVVILTDGKNEYSKDKDLTLERLLKEIELDRERPVKIFCVAFDQESKLPPLEKIATASAGKAFNATDPTTIDEAFVKVLSSF